MDAKEEQLALRDSLRSALADSVDAERDMKRAYEELALDDWIHDLSEDVVHSLEYENMEPVEAARWLSTVFAVARQVQERLQRRFKLIVCASSSVWPYWDSAGEQQAAVCETYYFATRDASAEAIGDAIATIVRMEAKDEDDTLFIHSLVKKARGLLISSLVYGAELGVGCPRYQTRFATVRKQK